MDILKALLADGEAPKPVDFEDDIKKYLLIGCGHSLDKRIAFTSDKGNDSPETEFIGQLVTVDWRKYPDQRSNPSIVADLNVLPYDFGEDYDEIHAYEVLEHCGAQGDADFFFGQFNEFHRMLKPDGLMMITVPVWNSVVAWGVPDHKRVMPLNLFSFLEERCYENVGKPGFADYRHLIKGFWEIVLWGEDNSAMRLVLRRI